MTPRQARARPEIGFSVLANSAAQIRAIGARMAVMAALGLVVAAPGEFAAGRSMMALSPPSPARYSVSLVPG